MHWSTSRRMRSMYKFLIVWTVHTKKGLWIRKQKWGGLKRRPINNLCKESTKSTIWSYLGFLCLSLLIIYSGRWRAILCHLRWETLKVLKVLEAVLGQLRKFLVDYSVLPLFEKSVSSVSLKEKHWYLEKQEVLTWKISQKQVSR